ncbi:MAG: GDSL-type esterase/lipase family protein [Saprospiraceae bacterium]|nr:GDSL-type esterase/lipase family protein [Saprospiraceae bacterium]
MYPPFTRLRLWACSAFFLLFMGQCQSQFRPPHVQITDIDTVGAGYSFIRQDDNAIENASYLEPVYQKLYTQRTQGGKKINIVHIGDSHILGDFLTREVRDRLQREFGDAGRGLLFPYKLAQTNGARDFLAETNSKWLGANCQRDLSPETNFGAAGLKLTTLNPYAELTFRLRDTATAESRFFTKVTIFQRKTALEYDVEVRDETSNQIAQLFIEDDYARSFYFDRPVGSVTIAAKKTAPQQKTLTLDGIAIENELSGVLYHSIGVNGAKYMDFARAKYFARQVADLEPDLVILSFGTNESQGNTEPAYMRRTMELLTAQILESSPGARIMLTTPADSYLRGRGLNPHMAETSKVIREFALEKGFALWDLFNFTGGKNSSVQWKSHHLMTSDSVHYTKSGYALQGKLLYQSLMNGYNGFVEGKR